MVVVVMLPRTEMGRLWVRWVKWEMVRMEKGKGQTMTRGSDRDEGGQTAAVILCF